MVKILSLYLLISVCISYKLHITISTPLYIIIYGKDSSLYLLIFASICILYKVDLVIYNYTATKLDFISKLQRICPDIEIGFFRKNIVFDYVFLLKCCIY